MARNLNISAYDERDDSRSLTRKLSRDLSAIRTEVLGLWAEAKKIASRVDGLEKAGDGAVDFVASSGLTDGWRWVKWDSGRCELHKSVMASFSTSVNWVAQQAYPFALTECLAAHVTATDYRVTKLYASPMENNGSACYVGGQASSAHSSNVCISVHGMWR